MPAKRVKRPKLDRDRPRREWSTLFGAGAAANPGQPSAAPPGKARADSAALSDTVEMGYRVIEDYLRQGRQVAQAFGAPSWMGGAPGGAGGSAPAASTDEMQQMAQRVMQYGWDFAGLWFEMWNRMGGAGGGAWPQPPGTRPAPSNGQANGEAPAPAGAGHAAAAAAPATTEALAVSVDSALPVTTSVELRPGPLVEPVIHALRPEVGDAPPIKDVSIERTQQGLLVRVAIAASQPAGTYRAAIVDGVSNLPQGALSVRVEAKKR